MLMKLLISIFSRRFLLLTFSCLCLAFSHVEISTIYSEKEDFLRQLDSLKNMLESTNSTTDILAVIEGIKRLVPENDSLASLQQLEISTCFYNLKNYDSTKWYLEKSLAVVINTKYDLLKIHTYDRLGVVLSDYGDNNSAINHYREALKIAEFGTTRDHKVWSAKIHGNIGGIYYDLEDYSKALEYASKAYKIGQEVKLETSYGVYHMQMGLSNLGLKNYSKAIEQLQFSVNFFEENFNPLFLQYGYINMGRIYLQTNDLISAEKSLQKAQNLTDSIESLAESATISELRAKIGLKRSDFKTAEYFAKRALQMALNYKMKLKEMEAFAMLYRIDSANGNFESALDYRNRYIHLNDSIRSQETIQRIAELETKYETEKKEKEIQLANVELEEKERFQFFLLITIALIIVFSIAAIVLLKQRFHLKQDLQSQEIDNLRLQLNTLLGRSSGGLDLDIETVNEKLNTSLSEREFDILQLALTDKNNKEIAESAFVSVNTVKFHLKNIYDKLGVSNRKEAMQFVIKPS